MRLTIEHRTRYQYGREVILQPHKLIVTPRDSGGLKTEASRVFRRLLYVRRSYGYEQDPE
jgi:transglutaminase-like putative cysteine protease